MPVTTKRYMELRFTISDYLQRRNWARLLDVCGTSDDETAKTIAVIFSLYDPKNVWKMLELAASLPVDERKKKRDTVATCCYIIGKMGQDDTAKGLGLLKQFLRDDRSVRDPVLAALSNLWVMDPKTTSSVILDSWIMDEDGSKDLQELGVKSTEYLASKEPKLVMGFLKKASTLSENRKIAAKISNELIARYAPNEMTTAKARHSAVAKK
jgi:hypothetical protein